MAAGVAHATGNDFVFMDSDLQLDPEELPLLLTELDAGADLVSGARKNRQDPLHRRVFSLFGNLVLRRMTRAPFTDFGCTFKVYRGALIRAAELGPHRPYTNLLMRLASRFREVPVTHHPRRYGRSGWTFGKLFRFNLDHVLALEGLFQTISGVAFLIALLTFTRIAVAWVLPWSVLSSPVSTGLILNALLLATATLLVVNALVGEYVIRLYAGQQRMPAYVVREVLPARASSERPATASEIRSTAAGSSVP
jgi:glycosyltransferase involved in cell wall biosynthesis